MKVWCALALSCILCVRAADGSAVKRPRVLPPMFLPTNGKRSSDWPTQTIPDRYDTEIDEFVLPVKRSEEESALPVPPIIRSLDRYIRVMRRPPTTLPVMKRGAYLVEMEEPEMRVLPPAFLSLGPVLQGGKRERPVDFDPYEWKESSLERAIRAPPSGLPIMKRRPPGGLPLVKRSPPTTLPIMKRRGEWIALMPGDTEQMERMARAPPSGLPIMKRRGKWIALMPGETEQMERMARAPPSGLPIMKRAQWAALIGDGDGNMAPSSFPVMKRNLFTDFYIAEKLAQEEG